MKFQKYFVKKIIAFSYAFLFSVPLIYSQIKTDKQSMNKANSKYGESIELKVNENVLFEDSLCINLLDFSHKRAIESGPTGLAELVISKDSKEIVLFLSMSQIGEKPERFYEEYEVQLKSFSYDESIEIIVFKNEERRE